ASRPPPDGVHFFTASPFAPGAPSFVGSNAGIHHVVGIAADATYFYVVGLDGDSEAGLFRVERGAPEAPAVRLKPLADPSAVVVDDLVLAQNLYVIDAGRIHVVAAPGSATPIDLGRSL